MQSSKFNAILNLEQFRSSEKPFNQAKKKKENLLKRFLLVEGGEKDAEIACKTIDRETIAFIFLIRNFNCCPCIM